VLGKIWRETGGRKISLGHANIVGGAGRSTTTREEATISLGVYGDATFLAVIYTFVIASPTSPRAPG
jgi:hypothetical protein